jgi:hypothetical protein
MTEINLAYYYVQDSLVTIILFGIFGMLATLSGLLLYLIGTARR